MSAGFSKVYEQWLKESVNEKVSSDNDRLYKDPVGLSELMDSDSSTDQDDDTKSLYYKHPSSKINRHTSDAAPTLLDDEDETTAGEKFQFDEPPVLEPVSRIGHHHKIDKKIMKKTEIPPFLGEDENKNRTSVIKQKTTICKKPMDFKSLKFSDNLFDKFNTSFSHREEKPPTLIPSPEALHPNSVSPERELMNEKKPQSSSPDFRAMEADSTSEILEVPSIKPLLADGMECDSTCMLGGSPHMVSHTNYNCVSESEVKDDTAALDTEAASPAERSRATAYSTESLRPPELGCEETWCKQEPFGESKINALSTLGLCPGQKIKNTSDVIDNSSHKQVDSSSSQPSTSNHMSPNVGVSDEPPILCAIRVPRNLKKNKKRHSSEAPSSSSKVKKTNSLISLRHQEDYWEVDCSSPPILPCMSDVVSPIVIRQSNHVLNAKSKSKSKNLRDHYHIKAAKIHNKTFPISEMENYANNLPDLQQQFVIATWQLSALKTSIYNLVKTLFPSFREELSTMTPESQAFQYFLKDLLDSLQQKDPLQAYIPIPLSPAINCNQNIATSCPNTIDQSSRKLPPHTNSLPTTTAPQDETITSSFRRLTRQSTHLLNSDVVQQFSNLELNSRSLHVHLCENNFMHVQQFSIFLCQLLQVLLPDLSISLRNELAADTECLVNFLDNVLVCNQRKKPRRHTLA